MDEEKNTTEVNTKNKSVPMQNFAIPLAIVIAGLAIAGAVLFGGKSNNAPSAPTAASNQPAQIVVDPVTSTDHILGSNPAAKVVIVEYSDTECPFCKLFSPTLARIMDEYGPTGKVALVYRHFPIHSKSTNEAEATECANKLGGNTIFWQYLTKIFDITPANDGLDPAELPKIATSLGLDETAFNTCLSSGEMKPIVDKDQQSGLKAGLQGTPYSIILVDGKVAGTIDGAQPYDVVKAQIDQLLK